LEIHPSAYKHGLTEADICHVAAHALVDAFLDPEADPPLILYIGPDTAGNIREVIALQLANDELAIHGMSLRPKFEGLLP
jgi:hypothetical protein